MQSIFVTATNTGIGKSHVMIQLLRRLKERGVMALPYKPIETGANPDPEDSLALLHEARDLFGIALTLEEVNPYRFALPASPFVAKQSESIAVDKIITGFESLKKKCDIVLVEGAGGLMVPIELDYCMVDLAAQLDLQVLLVTPAVLGCINDTLLSLEALERRAIPYQWCVNILPEEEQHFNQITRPFYKNRFESLHCLPNDWDLLIDLLQRETRASLPHC